MTGFIPGFYLLTFVLNHATNHTQSRWQTLPNYKNHETYIEIITFYAASLSEL